MGNVQPIEFFQTATVTASWLASSPSATRAAPTLGSTPRCPSSRTGLWRGGRAEHCSVCCTVLCCTVLYCAVLYCTVLYCTVLYCTVGSPEVHLVVTRNFYKFFCDNVGRN